VQDFNKFSQQDVTTWASISEEPIEGATYIGYIEIKIDSNIYKKYYTLDDSPNPFKQEFTNFSRTSSGFIDVISYYRYEQNLLESEFEFFSSSYGNAEPTVQFNLNTIEKPSPPQQYFETEILSYDLLSPLLESQNEDFTINAVTGSVTGTLSTPTEGISDVGGISTGGTDRETTTTGISTRIATSAGLGPGVRSTTVSTSGY
jgi:hypothetical protein